MVLGPLVLIIAIAYSSSSPLSIESCLSAQLINRTRSKLNQHQILPVDCYCTPLDLTCINVKSNQVSSSQLLYTNQNVNRFPTLSLLFYDNETMSNEDEDASFYATDKQKLSFFGYSNLVPYLFHNVKFVANGSIVFINFIDSIHFPDRVFASFGNLAGKPIDNWPRVYMSLFVEELTQDVPLRLDPNSLSGIRIEKLTIQDTSHKVLAILANKYPGHSRDVQVNEYTIEESAFNGSFVNVLEINDSNGFKGFKCDTDDSNRGVVRALSINRCKNFGLISDTQSEECSVPRFSQLSSLSIVESGLRTIPSNFWLDSNKNDSRFQDLTELILSDNKIEHLSINTFHGLEQGLERLDLSNNSIKRIDWYLFESFESLKQLNLSYNPLVNWLDFKLISNNENTKLEVLSLKGFKLASDEADSLCFRTYCISSDVFVELDSDFECNCFTFYIYKHFRMNNPDKNWVLGGNYTVPECYRELYIKGKMSFSLIQAKEETCEFNEILSGKCPLPVDLPATVQGKNSIASPKSSIVAGKELKCSRRREYAITGLTVIKIGNETSISSSSNNNSLIKLNSTSEIWSKPSLLSSSSMKASPSVKTKSNSDKLLLSDMMSDESLTLIRENIENVENLISSIENQITEKEASYTTESQSSSTSSTSPLTTVITTESTTTRPLTSTLEIKTTSMTASITAVLGLRKGILSSLTEQTVSPITTTILIQETTVETTRASITTAPLTTTSSIEEIQSTTSVLTTTKTEASKETTTRPETTLISHTTESSTTTYLPTSTTTSTTNLPKEKKLIVQPDSMGGIDLVITIDSTRNAVPVTSTMPSLYTETTHLIIQSTPQSVIVINNNNRPFRLEEMSQLTAVQSIQLTTSRNDITRRKSFDTAIPSTTAIPLAESTTVLSTTKHSIASSVATLTNAPRTDHSGVPITSTLSSSSSINSETEFSLTEFIRTHQSKLRVDASLIKTGVNVILHHLTSTNRPQPAVKCGSSGGRGAAAKSGCNNAVSTLPPIPLTTNCPNSNPCYQTTTTPSCGQGNPCFTTITVTALPTLTTTGCGFNNPCFTTITVTPPPQPSTTSTGCGNSYPCFTTVTITPPTTTRCNPCFTTVTITAQPITTTPCGSPNNPCSTTVIIPYTKCGVPGAPACLVTAESIVHHPDDAPPPCAKKTCPHNKLSYYHDYLNSNSIIIVVSLALVSFFLLVVIVGLIIYLKNRRYRTAKLHIMPNSHNSHHQSSHNQALPPPIPPMLIPPTVSMSNSSDTCLSSSDDTMDRRSSSPQHNYSSAIEHHHRHHIHQFNPPKHSKSAMAQRNKPQASSLSTSSNSTYYIRAKV